MNEPRTPAGQRVWGIIQSCAAQVRLGLNGVIGLDYAAVIAFAQLGRLDCDAADLLGACLPEVEFHILNQQAGDD